MTTQDKNIAIAEMLGAVKENWYPPNKLAGTTGDYYVFPAKTWYPDNVRQHRDNALKFDSDANWQYAAIEWIEKQSQEVSQHVDECSIGETIDAYYHRGRALGKGKNRLEATFEALYQFSQYLKEQNEK